MAFQADQSKTYLQELVTIAKNYPVAISYQKLNVTSGPGSTAVSMTVPDESAYAEITLESTISTAAVRHLSLGDTTLPTSTDGLVLYNLDRFTIIGYQNLLNFRAIVVNAGTHNLHIQYYK